MQFFNFSSNKKFLASWYILIFNLLWPFIIFSSGFNFKYFGFSLILLAIVLAIHIFKTVKNKYDYIALTILYILSLSFVFRYESGYLGLAFISFCFVSAVAILPSKARQQLMAWQVPVLPIWVFVYQFLKQPEQGSKLTFSEIFTNIFNYKKWPIFKNTQIGTKTKDIKNKQAKKVTKAIRDNTLQKDNNKAVGLKIGAKTLSFVIASFVVLLVLVLILPVLININPVFAGLFEIFINAIKDTLTALNIANLVIDLLYNFYYNLIPTILKLVAGFISLACTYNIFNLLMLNSNNQQNTSQNINNNITKSYNKTSTEKNINDDIKIGKQSSEGGTVANPFSGLQKFATSFYNYVHLSWPKILISFLLLVYIITQFELFTLTNDELLNDYGISKAESVRDVFYQLSWVSLVLVILVYFERRFNLLSKASSMLVWLGSLCLLGFAAYSNFSYIYGRGVTYSRLYGISTVVFLVIVSILLLIYNILNQKLDKTYAKFRLLALLTAGLVVATIGILNFSSAVYIINTKFFASTFTTEDSLKLNIDSFSLNKVLETEHADTGKNLVALLTEDQICNYSLFYSRPGEVPTETTSLDSTTNENDLSIREQRYNDLPCYLLDTRLRELEDYLTRKNKIFGFNLSAEIAAWQVDQTLQNYGYSLVSETYIDELSPTEVRQRKRSYEYRYGDIRIKNGKLYEVNTFSELIRGR